MNKGRSFKIPAFKDILHFSSIFKTYLDVIAIAKWFYYLY